MKLNFKAFFFSLVVLPNFANGQYDLDVVTLPSLGGTTTFETGNFGWQGFTIAEAVTVVQHPQAASTTVTCKAFCNSFTGTDPSIVLAMKLGSNFDDENDGEAKGTFTNCDDVKVTLTNTGSTSQLYTMLYAFGDNAVISGELTCTDTAFPDRATLMAELQSGVYDATSVYGPIKDWDVSKVTDMSGGGDLFNGLFNEDISGWNVGSVTSMDHMFLGAKSFNGTISNWNVGKVTNMRAMFSQADIFNGDISRWNVGLVTTMYHMFLDAEAFNGDISKWNVGLVTTMVGMFHGALAFDQNLCCWGTDLGSNTIVTEIFKNSGCGNKVDPTLSADIPSLCQACTDPLVFSTATCVTDLERAWMIDPLQFEKIGNKIIINTPNYGDGGKLIWRVYQTPFGGLITDATSTCFSNGGQKYGGSGLVGLSLTDSSLELSIVDGIAGTTNSANVYSEGSPSKVFFCVFLGLTESVAVNADIDPDTEFFSFEELAFEVTMQLEGTFTATAFNARAKEVFGKDAQTNYGVTAFVGACGEDVDLNSVDVYNQGAAVPICVCPDEIFTTVTSFTTLNFKIDSPGGETFPAVTPSGIVSTSSFNANVIFNTEGMSCKQIDSLLPQYFYNADTNDVVASGTVVLDIGRRRRTAEVNLRSLQNVEEKEFGAEFKLAPATVEAESSTMSCYHGMIAGMASLLLAAAMI